MPTTIEKGGKLDASGCLRRLHIFCIENMVRCGLIVVSLGKTLYGNFPCLVSWRAVLNYNHISIKLQADSNILASPEAGWGNCLPYVLAPPSLSCESGG